METLSDTVFAPVNVPCAVADEPLCELLALLQLHPLEVLYVTESPVQAEVYPS